MTSRSKARLDRCSKFVDAKSKWRYWSFELRHDDPPKLYFLTLASHKFRVQQRIQNTPHKVFTTAFRVWQMTFSRVKCFLASLLLQAPRQLPLLMTVLPTQGLADEFKKLLKPPVLRLLLMNTPTIKRPTKYPDQGKPSPPVPTWFSSVAWIASRRADG